MDEAKGGRAAEQVLFLDPSAAQPIHAQLADSLRQQIATGEYRPGEKLPSGSMLVEMYQVSPVTISRAINWLIPQDVVTTVR